MKKLNYLFGTLCLLLVGMSLQAQTWSQIGNGISQDTSRKNDVEVYNNELYVSEIIYNQTTFGIEIKVRKWDGQSWTTLPVYTNTVFTEFGDMAIYQGEIYVGLVYANGTAPFLIKYDGSKWVNVLMPNGANVRSIRRLKVHNGELYIGGYFDFTIGSSTYSNIVKYDGTSFTPLPGISGVNKTVSDIHFHNNDIYCIAINSIYKWNGSSFAVAAQIVSHIRRAILTSYNNDLYCASDTSLYKMGSAAATLIKTFPYKITDMDVHNGELYVVGDTIRKTWTLGGGLTKYDGKTFSTLTAPDGLHSGVVYNGELHYFSCSVTMYNSTQYDRAFKMDGVLSTDELVDKQPTLSVYPNPAHGLFYIENSLNQKQEVKLIDATGKVIRNISLQPSMKAEVGTGNLAPGMYFINNGSNTHRVIITP